MIKIGEYSRSYTPKLTIDRSIVRKGFPFTSMVSFIVTMGVLTLSLALFTILDGYAVTFASLLIFIYCLYAANKLRINHIVSYLLVISFLFINSLLYVKYLDIIEFVKSFLLTSVMLFVYITSLKPREELIRILNFNLILKFATYTILSFELIQVFEHFFIGTHLSWFWLDDLSISTATSVSRFESVAFLGFFRPVSFYYEPSYLACISFILLLINDRTVKNKSISYSLILSVVLSLSAVGIGFLLLYLASKIFHQRGLKLFFLLFIAMIIIASFGNEVINSLRIMEITLEGSSGHERLIKPFILVKEVLAVFALGIPLGQSEIVYNNSFFLLFLYFGILAPFLIIAWFFLIWLKIKNSMYFISYSLGVLSLLMVNGAIFTIESAFLLLLLNYAYMNRFVAWSISR